MSKRTSPKKLLALLVATLMSLMIVIPATADPLPPATGNLHIHKYIGGPTNDSNNGTELDTSAWTGVVPVNGVQFDLFKVDISDGIPASGKTYVLNGGNLLVYDLDNTLLGTYPVASAGSVTTAVNGTAVASNLDQGLYLVIENTVASTNITNAITDEQLYISAGCAPFLVAVPMTNPGGDGWLENVHVYPKNEALTVDKEASTDEAVAVGDTVGYKITTSVPADIATSKKYDVIDILDLALDIDLSSIKVVKKPSNVQMTEGASADYTVNYDSLSQTLKISFTDSGRAALHGSTHVEVSFDTTINEKVLEYLDNVVSNSATVQFTNKDDKDFEGEGDEVDVHTASIKVTKVDEKGDPLNGSSFKIASSEANAKASRFLRMDPVDSKLYDYDPGNPTTSKWATLGATADYKISPNNTDRFTGLRDELNNVWQSYYIVETQAPPGYNLLSEAIKVTFDGDEIDFTKEVTVKNSKGFTLPVTGGLGTIAFTVAGIVLVGAAIILVISRKRKSESDCRK